MFSTSKSRSRLNRYRAYYREDEREAINEHLRLFVKNNENRQDECSFRVVFFSDAQVQPHECQRDIMKA